MNWRHPEITETIRRALAEDIGSGDITTQSCVAARRTAAGFFLARELMVLAGLELLPQIYDQEQVDLSFASGDQVAADVVIARVQGRARRLLTLERTALNFLQRLCGVATQARRIVEAVKGTRCQVLDTRKTTPGLRRLEKLAVQAGGAANHRLGLFDAILIKNNHIAAAGGVKAALKKARSNSKDLPIEIEVRSFEELDEALAGGAERVLLDNFAPERIRQAVGKIAGRAKVEVSGGINLENIRTYAETGADYVSVGAMTHSARAMDISFRLDQENSEDKT